MSPTVELGQGPAHRQIENHFASAIASGTLTPGDRLPTEREVCEMFGVSRMTVRQALQSLERSGSVVRRKGRTGGTFVAEVPIDRDLSTLTSLWQKLREQGHETEMRVLSNRLCVPTSAAAVALGLSPDDAGVEITRVRLADARALSIERSILPAATFASLVQMSLDRSLFDLLEEQFSIYAEQVVTRVRAVLAAKEDAAILGVDVGSPLIELENIAHTPEGVAFMYEKLLFRGDRARLIVTRGREHHDLHLD